MNYDQLAESVREQRAALAAAHAEAEPLRTQAEWYDGFDPNAAGTALAEVDRLGVELSEARDALDVAKKKLRTDRTLYALSWHPTALLVSKTVRAARKQLRLTKAAVADLTARQAELGAQREQALATLADARAESERHEAFDRAAAAERLSELDTVIAEIAPTHEMRATRLDRINEQLTPLLADLQQVRRDLERVRHSGPRAGKLRGEEKRIEDRIRKVKRKGTMEVRRVIIDGSNLRFDDSNGKIGLFALRPLCAALPSSAEVLVVFDATILRQLGYPNEAALQKRMPGVPVKVVSSKTDADELILGLAEDETTYVLSNDTYPEYTTTPAMRDERVLPVEIIDSLRLVAVPMLDLKVAYSREA